MLTVTYSWMLGQDSILEQVDLLQLPCTGIVRKANCRVVVDLYSPVNNGGEEEVVTVVGNACRYG